jgi:NDP-sugar pyrophosphorylase family protein
MTKSQKEKGVENAYTNILKQVVEPLSGDKTTYLTELNGVGKKLFGVKYKGTFPSDKIPRLNDLSPYAILNLDKSTESGSHWVAIAKHPNKNETLLYDSFARRGTKIIPSLTYSGNGRIIDSDLKDREQEIVETNCGARCLAYLVVVEKYGWDAAKLI